MSLDTATRHSISKTIQLLDVFRQVDPNMPIGEMVAFLMVASDETISVAELAERGAFIQSTAGKYMQAIGSAGKKTDKGGRTEAKELVKEELNPLDQRRLVRKPTTKGRMILNSLNKLWGH